MDWFGENSAEILFGRKMVYINPHRKKPFVIYGDKSRVKFGIITMMKSRRCLNKWCKTFLAYVINIMKEKKAMTGISLVCDFLDVFPNEWPGLPLEGQVEFRIDLMPDKKPIEKVSYRLALTSMKEVMTQVQELLNNGFTRHSSSPF